MIAILIQLMMFITPAICVVTIALKYDEVKRASQSISWPAVRAKIMDSQISATGKKYKGANLYSTEVTLAYAVDGETYQVKQYPADQKGLTDGPKQWARQLSLQYRPGKPVKLYYNPKRPKQATLQPGFTTVSSSKWMVIGVVMMIVSFILHMLSVYALSNRFLENITRSSSLVLGLITFTVTIIVGVLIFLIFQEAGEKGDS